MSAAQVTPRAGGCVEASPATARLVGVGSNARPMDVGSSGVGGGARCPERTLDGAGPTASRPKRGLKLGVERPETRGARNGWRRGTNVSRFV